MKTKLMAHQLSALEFLYTRPAMMLAFDMGTGKTAIAVRLMQYDKNTHKRKFVVVCPAYLTRNWAAEIEKFGDDLTWSIKKTGATEVDLSADVIIVSYSLIEKVEAIMRVRRAVIYDEAHYLCGRKSQRTRITQDIANKGGIDRLLLMTGTPMRNRISDLYSLFVLLNKVWNHGFLRQYASFAAFAETFCNVEQRYIPSQRFSITTYSGHKNLEWLRPWLNLYWMKCKISHVIDLPPINYEMIEIGAVTASIEKKLEVAWQQHETGIVAKEHQYGENVGEHIAKAKAMSALAKADETALYCIDQLVDGHGPMVIFSDHRESTEKIFTILKTFRETMANCEGRTFRVAMIRGDTSSVSRASIVDKFQRGELDAIVATIGALQTGVTLTKAHVCIFNDLAWDPASNAQAAGRIYRIGQPRPCFVHICVGGPIDRKIVKMLRSKEETIAQVMQ